METNKIKGYLVPSGFMGWVESEYMLFATESEYYEYVEEDEKYEVVKWCA